MPAVYAHRLLALVACLTLFGAPAHAERVRSLDTQVDILRDGTLRVSERVHYDAEGAWRRGAVRDLNRVVLVGEQPTRLEITVLDVRDDAGRAIVHREEQDPARVRVWIGDQEGLRSGELAYILEYEVRGAIAFGEERDGLVWNVTGWEWAVPVDRATAAVAVPSAGSHQITRSCYTGPPGARDPACSATVSEGQWTFSADDLPAGHGLTVGVEWPSGIVSAPTAWSRFRAQLRAVPTWTVAPLVVALLMLFYASRRGVLHRVGEVSLALPDVRPAVIGAVWDDSVDLDDVVATVLDLAVRGHISVLELPSSRRTFFARRAFQMNRNRDVIDPISAWERALLDALFEMSDVVLVSSLRRQAYRELPRLRAGLYRHLSQEVAVLTGAPQEVRGRLALAGWALVLIGLLALFLPALPYGASYALFGSATVLFIGGAVLPLRSRAGVLMRRRAAGLRAAMTRLAPGAVPEDAPDFHTLLPYAWVLGVADDWVRAHDGHTVGPPPWFRELDAADPLEVAERVARFGRTLASALRERPEGYARSAVGVRLSPKAAEAKTW